MYELNNEIRSLELDILDREVEIFLMKKNIKKLRFEHKNYVLQLSQLRNYVYATKVMRIELDFKKRQLEIIKVLMAKDLIGVIKYDE